MKETHNNIKGVKNQTEIQDIICGYIADNIAEILRMRGILNDEQLEQIKEKNRELFTRKK